MASKAAASDDESTIKVTTTKKTVGKDGKGNGGTIKLKKPPLKHNKPGNWRDGSVVDDDKKKTESATPASSAPSPGPVVNQLDDSARETFPTGRPLEDELNLTKCTICKKSMLKSVAGTHVAACNKAKKEKAQRKKEAKEAREKEKRIAEGREEASDEEEGKGAGKKVVEGKGKKRKVDEAGMAGEKSVKKKKKVEEVKVKVPKTRGPVDVERQCGVIKDGVPCARSLTCKSHPMGAKRAVPGRSLPYDMLLAAYQKKNQAKQQKAAIDANAPLEDPDAALGPVDSDEELTSVMHGLTNWNPQPVVQPLLHIPIEKKYLRERLREQLHQATNGFTVNIFRVRTQDEDVDMDASWARRESAFGGLPGGGGPMGARRQSNASQR